MTESIVGDGAGSSSGGGGGAMVGPGRDQARRGWNCGANGGWWGDDGRAESRAGRSAGVHGESRGLAERRGGGVVGQNRPDEDLGGGEGAEGDHVRSKATKSPKPSSGKRIGRMTGMGKEEGVPAHPSRCPA